MLGWECISQYNAYLLILSDCHEIKRWKRGKWIKKCFSSNNSAVDDDLDAFSAHAQLKTCDLTCISHLHKLEHESLVLFSCVLKSKCEM